MGHWPRLSVSGRTGTWMNRVCVQSAGKCGCPPVRRVTRQVSLQFIAFNFKNVNHFLLFAVKDGCDVFLFDDSNSKSIFT